MDSSRTGPIVVATDHSDHASSAVERALIPARAQGRHVVLVHALGLDVPAETDCDVLVVPLREAA